MRYGTQQHLNLTERRIEHMDLNITYELGQDGQAHRRQFDSVESINTATHNLMRGTASNCNT